MFGRVASLIVSAALILASASGAADAPEGRVFGKGVSNPSDTVLISDLLADPAKYIDQTVRVSGTVVGVCAKRGCWMDIASDKEFQTIQVKVTDGEIVFPMEIMGETAVAEGVFTGIPMTMEQTCNYLEHEAKCQGKEFDRESVEGPTTFYRLTGLGAVVTPAEPSEKTADDAASDTRS